MNAGSQSVPFWDHLPLTLASRQYWFDKHSGSRRPIWVAENAERVGVIGYLAFGYFMNERPGYYITADLAIYLAETGRSYAEPPTAPDDIAEKYGTSGPGCGGSNVRNRRERSAQGVRETMSRRHKPRLSPCTAVVLPGLFYFEVEPARRGGRLGGHQAKRDSMS